jgi:DNA-binding CsgD family transcriptional regulator
MEEISMAVGATGAVLLQSDVRTPDVPRTASLHEAMNFYFQENWHTRDIRANRGVPLLLRGALTIADQDFVTPDEIRRDSFYNDMVARFGFRWFAAIGFRAGPALWALSIQRTASEGPFDEPDRRILGALSQRLTEVSSLSTAVGRVALLSAASALNAVRHPAIAIDRFGFVLDANAAAEAVFDDCIHLKGRQLFVADADGKWQLNNLFDRLRITPDTEAVNADPIIVRRAGARPVIIRVLPVHGAARTPFLGARALLTLTPVERRPGPSTALLAQLFKLTPAEAKLASLVAEGSSPGETAEQLGISRATARTQLKAVFVKTDTHRQSELVALLARLSA